MADGNSAASKKYKTLVAYYIENMETCRRLQRQINGTFSSDPILSDSVHSIRSRVKEPSHLADKLDRMNKDAEKKKRGFSVTTKNLFTKVYDCVGFRLLHIRAQDFPTINHRLDELIPALGHKIVKGPIARAWDDESRKYYQELGIETVRSERMYTSVHYHVEVQGAPKMHYEIQVRTLMEEVWGEVDHSFNYPERSKSIACQEQIYTLARLISGCNRLVESIYKSHDESKTLLAKRSQGVTRKRPAGSASTMVSSSTRSPRKKSGRS